MKALILKDFYVVIKQMKIFLLFILVFSLLPGSTVNIFAVVYSAMLPYTSIAYDERSHWDQLALTMPYSMRNLVLSKYILGWICIFSSSLFSTIIQTILALAPFTHAQPEHRSMLIGICTGIILMALTMPLIFRFGVERGRMIFVAIVGIWAGVAGGLIGLASATVTTGMMSEWILLAALPAAAVVLTAISVPLSIRLYRVH